MTGGGSDRYRQAGVDIAAADAAVTGIASLVRSTQDSRVLAGMGAFAGLWRIPGLPGTLLAATMDGVGTKLRVAQAAGRHHSIGLDLVNHCVNDLLASGARPALFLDYFACGRLDGAVLREIVEGMAEACREAGCAILGGETAEMPGFYPGDDYDLAGCMIGLAREEGLPGPSRVRAGQVLVGLASSGLHTNGFSLARRVLLEEGALDLGAVVPPLGVTLGEELLRPHRSYLAPIGPLLDAGRLAALAHITGGGIPGNLVRLLPEDLSAVVRRGSWPVPPVFTLIRDRGGVPESEMERVFNLGLGMILAVEAAEAAGVLAACRAAGVEGWPVGEIVCGPREVRIA